MMNDGNYICQHCYLEITPKEPWVLAAFRNPTYAIKNHIVYLHHVTPSFLRIHETCMDSQARCEARSLKYDKTLGTPGPKPRTPSPATIDERERELLDLGDFSDETPRF